MGVVGWLILSGLALWLVSDRTLQEEGDGQVWLAYSVTPGHPLSMALSGGRAVRVQLWLETPEPWAPDPRATSLVEMGWRALDGEGRVLNEGTSFTSTRSGWALPENLDGPLSKVVTGANPGRVFSDPRTFSFETPATATTLELSALHLPAGAQVLVVAFEQDQRDTVEQMRAVVGANVEQSARIAGRMGRFGWNEVPLDWRERFSRTLWRRLASTDQGARPVRLVSGDSWLGMNDAAALGFAMPLGGAAAYNLEGEVVFQADWTGPDGAEARPTRTWLEIMGEGFGEVQDLGRVSSIGPLHFEPGVREVRIARDPHDVEGVVLLRATTRGEERDRAWGDPPRAEFPSDGGARAVQRVAPDVSGLIFWRVRAGAPLIFTLPPEHEIRVVARPRLPPGRLPGLGPGVPEESRSLVLERAGTFPWSETLSLPSLPSAFERYTQGDDPSTARVAEESEWFLASTSEASTLTIRSSDEVDVQVFVKEHVAPSDVPEPGYPVDDLSESIRARYLPYARRTWRANFPLDPDALAWEGRAIRIDAQVRWVYRGEGGGTGLDYRVLELPPPFDLVAEARVGGNRTRLVKAEQTLEIPETGRVLVDYSVPPGTVGKTVSVHFEGREEERELLSSVGTLRFERLPPGPLRASVNAAGLFLANVPGERPWAVRRVWRMDPGRSRVIKIPEGGDGLSVHVARRKEDGKGSLTWRMRGEGVDELLVSDRRREGRMKLSTQVGKAQVLSRVEDPWVWTEPLRLRVGQRSVGTSSLELTLEDRSGPVWIWVSSTWAPPNQRLDERHWAIPGVGQP